MSDNAVTATQVTAGVTEPKRAGIPFASGYDPRRNLSGRPPARREAEYNEARRRAVTPEELQTLTRKMYLLASEWIDKGKLDKALPAYERLSDELGGKPSVHVFSEGNSDLNDWLASMRASMSQREVSGIGAIVDITPPAAMLPSAPSPSDKASNDAAITGPDQRAPEDSGTRT